MNMRTIAAMTVTLVWPLFAPHARADESTGAPADVMTRALVDEMDRSMQALKLGDLPPPYLIQLNAQDRWSLTMNASYGGIVSNVEQRDRFVSSRTRVGSYELDNTNFGRPFGNAGRLPLDDDYTALRHAIWSVLDDDYKGAVETIAGKVAYLKDHTIEDRADDYTVGEAVVATEPRAKLDINRNAWVKRLEAISARFSQYPRIQEADVSFTAATADHWIINSEGTRLRMGDRGALIKIDASLQASDGMPLRDGLSYLALTTDELPTTAAIIEDLDKLCTELVALADAPTLRHYTGPVLFDPVPAGKAFDALLAGRLCARPVPIGSGWEDESFENRIGLRILPRSFIVYDDPATDRFEGTALAGSYKHDDEGTPAQRVNLVEKGILKTLVSSRSPTRRLKSSNGHGRNMGFGDAFASVGVLYVENEEGLPPDELKQELIVAAKEEGLEYGLRVKTMGDGEDETLGEPIQVVRVYADDGHEELVRGLTFQPVTPRALKRLIAAGKDRQAYNAISQVSSSFIVPAILFEELDLSETAQEFAKPPVLPSPLERTKDRS